MHDLDLARLVHADREREIARIFVSAPSGSPRRIATTPSYRLPRTSRLGSPTPFGSSSEPAPRLAGRRV